MPKPGVAPPFNSQRPPGTAYTVVWDRRQPLTKPNLLFEILVLQILYLYYRRFHSFYDVLYSSLCSFAIIPADCYGVEHMKVCNVICFI